MNDIDNNKIAGLKLDEIILEYNKTDPNFYIRRYKENDEVINSSCRFWIDISSKESYDGTHLFESQNFSRLEKPFHDNKFYLKYGPVARIPLDNVTLFTASAIVEYDCSNPTKKKI